MVLEIVRYAYLIFEFIIAVKKVETILCGSFLEGKCSWRGNFGLWIFWETVKIEWGIILFC